MATFTQLCQLAADWKGDMPEGGMLAEEKHDGWRCLYFKGIDGQSRLWSRNGIPLEGADHVLYRLRQLEAQMGVDMFFDGEIVVDGSLDATKHWFEKGWKTGGDKGQFYGFDCMSLDQWRSGGCDMPLVGRRVLFESLLAEVADDEALSWEWREGSRGNEAHKGAVIVTPEMWVLDVEDCLDTAQRIWSRGGEGLMLKDAQAPYQRNRNDAWLKVKQDGPWLRKLGPIAA